MRGASWAGVLVLCSLPAHAADFWQRTQQGVAVTQERETLEALHRTLEGTADALDELSVRVAMVDAKRGRRYENRLTHVYLARTRRLLGLSSPPSEVDLLRELSHAGASREERSLSAIELARILRLGGDDAGAHAELDLALEQAWRSEVRVEALLMRGWLAADTNDLERARADFRATLELEPGRMLLGLTLASLSWVELLRGDEAEARRLHARAKELTQQGTSVNGSKLEDRPELLPIDRAALLELERRLLGPGGEH